jgi:hypothetical protein
VARTGNGMADDAGLEPDASKHRKRRDHEVGGSTVEDGTGKVEEEASNQRSNAERAGSRANEERQAEEKKPSKLQEMWGKLGLDMGTVMMMFKYVLPICVGLFGCVGSFG